MAKTQESSSIAQQKKRFDEAETKVASLQKQLAEAQQERETAGEELSTSLTTMLSEIGGNEEPAVPKASARIPHKDRVVIHARRIKRGRGNPVPMIEVRKHYANETGKDVKVVAQQVKADCEKSDLFKVKGKGKKTTVEMA